MSAEGRPSGLERRRAERIPMPPRGGVVSVVGARVINATAYGLLIESLVPMERDSVMQLRLVVAGEKADVEARVAGCSVLTSARRPVFGIGLEFVKLNPALEQRLTDALTASQRASPA